MQVLFVGSGAFGLPVLKHLVETQRCVGVVTGVDKPVGRNRKLSGTPVGIYSESNNLPLIKTIDINDEQSLDSFDFDVMVVIAFGQKIKSKLLSKYRAINLHASLLPRWRGASPINAAIMNGDSLTGLSVIALENRIDAGPILGQIETEIDPEETAGALHDRLSLLGPQLLDEVLLGDSDFSGMLQDENFATYSGKLSRKDALLDLSASATQVSQKIRGLSPWPGCHLLIGGVDCKILSAVAKSGMGEPGEILADGTIATGIGSIEVLQIKPAGGSEMTWKDFCNGRSIKEGEICKV